jgi:hypothetical protein
MFYIVLVVLNNLIIVVKGKSAEFVIICLIYFHRVDYNNCKESEENKCRDDPEQINTLKALNKLP